MDRQVDQILTVCEFLKFHNFISIYADHFEWIYSGNNFVPMDLWLVIEANDIVRLDTF